MVSVLQPIGSAQDRLVEELDYEHEADVQRSFADGYAGDDHIAVPAVIQVGRRVLVTEWMEGRPLAAVIADGTAVERNAAGRSLLRLLLRGGQRPHQCRFSRAS